MQCRKCHAEWNLECGLGPGGNASPGQYSAVALGVGLIAIACWWVWSLWAGIAFGGVAILVFLMALGGSGYPQPSTAYQGCICPKCGQKNWIWPWNF